MPKGSGIGSKFWRYVRWAVILIVIFFVGLTVYRLPAVELQKKSAEAVAYIHSSRLSMSDVDGTNLPPAPDPGKVDATVQGIDANGNGIRDDVELAIFAKYPNSPFTRTAELQYAMALQLFLTHVFSPETWIAAAQQLDRAEKCIRESYSKAEQGYSNVVLARVGEVESDVFNTQDRGSQRSAADELRGAFAALEGDSCDLYN